MRSKGDIDIGAVAKEFGGGGHKNAAGCTVDAVAHRRRCRSDSFDRQKTDRAIATRAHRCIDMDGCSSSTSRRPDLARRRRARAARRSASSASATPARSIRWPPACCRSSLGRATRLARFLSASDKSYEAVDPPRRRDRHVRRARARRSGRRRGARCRRARRSTRRSTRSAARSCSSRRRSRRRRSTAAAATSSRAARAPCRASRRARPAAPALPAPVTVTAHAIDVLERRRRPRDAARRLLGRLLRPVAGARPRRAARDAARISRRCGGRGAATSRSTQARRRSTPLERDPAAARRGASSRWRDMLPALPGGRR